VRRVSGRSLSMIARRFKKHWQLRSAKQPRNTPSNPDTRAKEKMSTYTVESFNITTGNSTSREITQAEPPTQRFTRPTTPTLPEIRQQIYELPSTSPKRFKVMMRSASTSITVLCAKQSNVLRNYVRK
jgi:hypothetical protein